MKALVLTAYNHFEYTDVPDPVPGAGEVLVRIEACGICGSDIHGMDGSTGRRIPPLIMGHEAAGVIVETGSGVSGWAPGDRITFDSTIFCGSCHFCRRGRPNLCDNRRVLGVSCGDYRQDGAFAEYVVVPQHIVYRLPASLTFERAVMIEALSVAVHAAGRTPLKLGESVVVVGAGMIGLLVVQAMRLAGCGRLFAVDVNASRLETARRLGADACLNPKEVKVPDEIRKRTGGRGADVAIEAVGTTETVETAVSCLSKGGRLVLVGNISPRVALALQTVVTCELSLLGSCASSGEYPICIDLLEKGAVEVDPLISAVAPLSEGGKWFETLHNGQPDLFKVVLKP